MIWFVDNKAFYFDWMFFYNSNLLLCVISCGKCLSHSYYNTTYMYNAQWKAQSNVFVIVYQ